jgi:D-cysteine desulfhydrase family pyridoxal phosphate-dependent enzyme
MPLKIEDIPRLRFAFLPTPLMKAERLSKELGGPTIWIKRDDLTGLAFGGNKIRKLEFLMADALAQGATHVLTIGGAQSNHAMQTATVARRVGLEPVLVLGKPRRPGNEGNLLLDRILGAEVRFPVAYDSEGLHKAMLAEAEKLRAQGHKPYCIPLGGSSALGLMGYVLAVKELMEQARLLGIKIDRVFAAFGSGGTHAGLVVGKKLYALDFEVVAVDVGAVKEGAALIAEIANEGAKMLGVAPLTANDVTVMNEFLGKGYAIPTPEGIAAIKQVARAEGIFLDPVYTSKAMAGLIAAVRAGQIGKDENIVFIHTGGGPGLFVFPECFA